MTETEEYNQGDLVIATHPPADKGKKLEVKEYDPEWGGVWICFERGKPDRTYAYHRDSLRRTRKARRP